jgi:hypothetical protein
MVVNGISQIESVRVTVNNNGHSRMDKDTKD